MNIIPFPQRPEMSLEALEQTCLNYLGESESPIVPVEILLAFCQRTPSLAHVSSEILLDFLRQHEEVEVLDAPTPIEALGTKVLGAAGVVLGPRVMLKRRIPTQREMYAIMALQLQDLLATLAKAAESTEDPAHRNALAQASERGETLLARLGTLMR